jgi:hypothetical protein
MFERFLLSFRGTEGKRALFWSTLGNPSAVNGILTSFEDREVKIIVDKFTRCAQRAFRIAWRLQVRVREAA